ncbi:BTAD domain-containing putative transcriptional regulator [Acetobacter sp. LMG 32666]|uniref:AfsR/SARP family transcriptional regulator n=1 Tax=Acetobacter sp. LMG 32666 TaxID=2959295 RepID=UPI0030C7A695
MHAPPTDKGAQPDRPLLNIFLLGHMRVLSNTGLSLLPTGTKTKALLAILALSNRRPVARTRLAELLWSKRAPEQARASLRQEIHRLMDVLHPLGPEVLDVQRHTLAIRPNLTDIDTEHVLRATPQTVMDLPDPLPPLLEDLSAVDPGFAVWLEEERNRLLDHKIAQLEALLASAPTPATIMAATRRLLRLNPLNEGAWRANILAAMHSEEEGTALLSAETCLRTFQDAIATTPGQETMRLIAKLRATHLQNTQAAAHTLPQTPHPAQTVADGSGCMLSATVFLACTQQQNNTETVALAEQFRGELGLDLAMHGVLDVSVQTEHFAASPFPSLPARGRWDFLIGITITGGSGSALTCLLQAFDTRLNDTIVWGHRLTLTPTTLRALSNRFAAILILSLFKTEARRMASIPVAELSPFGLGLRAFTLSMRADAGLYHTIEHLLNEAEKRAPENQFLLFVRAHYLLIRMYDEWHVPVADAIRPMITMLKQNFALFPGNRATRYLLSTGLFYANQPDEARFLLAQMHLSLPTDSPASMLALPDGLDALCRGDAVTAARIYTDFFSMVSTMPQFSAPDQEFILSCFLADQYEETLLHARGILATSPDRSAILVPALAAANMLGHQSLAQDYRQRLHRLQTPLTPCAIEGHYAYLPLFMRQKLCHALHLPQP